MKLVRKLSREQDGAATVEMAFALPILIVFIWFFVQLGEVYQAMSGMQQALGQGARYATLCLNPSTSGCSVPTATQIKTDITNSVYGTGPGTFTVADPTTGSDGGTGHYYDLQVTYSQPTSLLLFPGPTVTISRSKRVWVAGTPS